MPAKPTLIHVSAYILMHVNYLAVSAGVSGTALRAASVVGAGAAATRGRADNVTVAILQGAEPGRRYCIRDPIEKAINQSPGLWNQGSR